MLFVISCLTPFSSCNCQLGIQVGAPDPIAISSGRRRGTFSRLHGRRLLLYATNHAITLRSVLLVVEQRAVVRRIRRQSSSSLAINWSSVTSGRDSRRDQLRKTIRFQVDRTWPAHRDLPGRALCPAAHRCGALPQATTADGLAWTSRRDALRQTMHPVQT